MDGMRGGAALAVLFGHWRNLFFLDAKSNSLTNLPVRFFYFASGFGRDAVMVFFVLSGLFISLGVLHAVAHGQWSWRRYLTHRLSRLWIVLIPALLLGFGWDWLGLHLFGTAQIYGGDELGGNAILWDVGARTTLPFYLGNLFFLQMIKVMPPGSNGPLWSLSFEFWYYLLFPLITLALIGRASSRFRIVHALGAFALCTLFLPRFIVEQFGIWLMGTAVIVAYIHGKIPATLAKLQILGVLAFLAVLTWLRSRNFEYNDLVLGIATAALIYFFISPNEKSWSPFDRPLIAKTCKTLSNFSFSLYVTHLPLLVFLRAYLVHDSRWPIDFPHLVKGSIVLVLALFQAYLFSQLTEKQTGKLRHLLVRLGSSGKTPPSAYEETRLRVAS